MLQRSLKMYLFALFIMLCAVGSGSASLESILEKLEHVYQTIDDFQADFEQTEFNPLLKRKKKSFGTIYSLHQGKLFWHTQAPAPLKVISDGAVIWLYYPESGQLFREKWETLDTQTKIALMFLRREAKLDRYFQARWKNKARREVELFPKKPLGVEKISMTLSKKRVFFEKLIFFFPLGRTTELIFKDIKFNQKLWQKHKKEPLDENISPSFHFMPIQSE